MFSPGPSQLPRSETEKDTQGPSGAPGSGCWQSLDLSKTHTLPTFWATSNLPAFPVKGYGARAGRVQQTARKATYGESHPWTNPSHPMPADR